MSEGERKREFGRGERVIQGLWRLRLPLPWPGVPHVNAYAIAAGEGIVLVDCGVQDEESMDQLEYAMRQVGLRLEQVQHLVITHAHTDHWGQSAAVADATDCEVWVHPNNRHGTFAQTEPERALERRLEIGRQSGIPEKVLETYARANEDWPALMGPLPSSWSDLVPGVRFATDLGVFEIVETPGHAPSHVSLFEATHRLLVSGDHVMGRVSQYYDYGYSPDPVGEFLASLDVVDDLDARLCVSGHGKPFTDVAAHIESNRKLVADRLAATVAALRTFGSAEPTAMQLIPLIYGTELTPELGTWWVQETLVLLTHLEALGQVEHEAVGGADRWKLLGGV